jgi:hypothetical protein
MKSSTCGLGAEAGPKISPQVTRVVQAWALLRKPADAGPALCVTTPAASARFGHWW